MIKFRKASIPTFVTLLVIQFIFFLVFFIPMNWGSMVRYHQNKEDSQILEGRITEVKRLGYRARFQTYNVTIEYTENGETKTAVFKKPVGKGVGDMVELIRLPDGVLVPRYLQFPGSAGRYVAVFIEVVFVLIFWLRMRTGDGKTTPLTTLVQPVEDDFEQYVSREEQLMKMVNQAQSTGVNVNEEVEISEEPEAVISVKKLDTIQDSPYSLEELGEYEGVNLDELIVEKM